MKNKFLLLILSAFLGLAYVNAQDKALIDLDKFFDQLEANNQFMGNVEVLKDGEIFYQRSIGYSKLEEDKKNTADTHFAIGSITKTYTAALVLMAFEESKLELDTKLSRFFPEIFNAEQISIKNMLQHRSGIPNITNQEDYLEWNTIEQTRETMLKRMQKFTSLFQPDTYFAYSNSNYILLSYILEDLYKMSYAEVLEKQILKPLNLKNTYIGQAPNNDMDIAASYAYQDKWIKEPNTHYTVPLGAGAIFATNSDLNKFGQALFTQKIITSASLQHMLDIKDSFGMGIISFPFNNMQGYGHSGGVDGFQSFYGNLPYEKISFSILGNGIRFPINNLNIALLQAATGIGEIDIPNFDQCALTTKEQEQYAGTYTSKVLPWNT